MGAGARGSRHGFTLPELLAGLSIATLLVALAWPAWSAWLAEERAQYAGARLLTGLAAARGAAIGSGSATRVCPAGDGGACISQRDWSRGWLVQQSGSGLWQTLDRAGLLPDRVRVEVAASALEGGVQFEPRGFAVNPSGGGFASGSWVVCVPGARARTITLAPSGRARISTGTACA